MRSDRLHKFLQQYSRKKQIGRDPNDRPYDRRVENEIKKMNPIELDSLLRFDGSEDNASENGS